MQLSKDKDLRSNLQFTSSRILRNGVEIPFESWDTNIQTQGAYSHGMSSVGVGYNGRSANIICPPANGGDISDIFMVPSEVRKNFPAFGDTIVIQCQRSQDLGDDKWITVFTGAVESTEYDYSSGHASVTCSDGLDLLLDTPVNVESALAFGRANPFTSLQMALANAGVGNVPPFAWNRTILTAPHFTVSSIPIYADLGKSSDTGERVWTWEPYQYSYTTEMTAYPHHYAQNYDTGGSGKCLVLTTRPRTVTTGYKTWNDRSCLRVTLANGSEIEVGYHGDTNNGTDYGYYVWTKARNVVWADQFKEFGALDNPDGNNNPAISLIYDTGGMTFVLGGEYKVVLSQTLPGGEPGTKVEKVYGRNIICADVRWEPDWTTALNVLKRLPKTNVAENISFNIFKTYSTVLDRMDGIQLGTAIKRICEAGMAGFWLDEFGRPTIYDMGSLSTRSPTGEDAIGSSAMTSKYVPRAAPEWKSVQVQHHTTQVWYKTLSPSTRLDYATPVYQHNADNSTQWWNRQTEFFIQPKNNKESWGAVWTDIYSVNADTKSMEGGSWIATVRLKDRDQDEVLYDAVKGKVYPLINSNYKVVLQDTGYYGSDDTATRTPKYLGGGRSALTDKWRNMATPVIRATWKSEKTMAKVTETLPEWNSSLPVLEVGDEETGLLLTEPQAKNLAQEIMKYSASMKGELKDYEILSDPRIQVGDTRVVSIKSDNGDVRAQMTGTVAGIRLGYSHSQGLVQSLTLVVRSETELPTSLA